jgi:F-type H+-transporting ATPase subunit b
MLLGSAAPVTTTTSAPLFLLPNGTFIVDLVIFVVVLGIVARFILPPITNAIREREAKVREGIEAGEEGRSEAERLDQERRSTLEAARGEARAILAEAQRDAEAKRDAARARGQEEYDRLVAGAAESIEAERLRAIEEISGSIDSLVVEAAERIVGAPVDLAKHRRAIDRIRVELGAKGEE